MATAWVGFDDNSMLGRNEYGGSAALPIWIDFMAHALADKPEINIPQPSGIVRVKIDPKTGLRVTPNQTGIYEIFRSKNIPDFGPRAPFPAPMKNPCPRIFFEHCDI